MEDYRIKYVKSLSKVLNELGWDGKNLIQREDESNLNMLIGHLYQNIKSDGNMTKELALELELEHLWEEEE